MLKTFLHTLALFAVFLISIPAFTDKYPDAEIYSRLPEIRNVRLSPDGSKLLLVNNIGNRSILRVLDLNNKQAHNVILTDNQRYQFGWIDWANNETLLLSTHFPMTEFGARYTQSRLAYLKFDGSEEPNFVGVTGNRSSTIAQFGDRVIDFLPDEPNHILINLAIDKPIYPSVYRYDLSKGSKTRVQRSRKGITGWLADQQHRIRVGSGYDDRSGESYWYIHNLEKDEWQEAWRSGAFDSNNFSIMGFGIDPHIVYLRGSHQGRRAIFTADLRDPELKTTLKASDPEYDILGSLIRAKKTGEVIGVYHNESEQGRIYWDESSSLFQQAIDKALPDTANFIVDQDETENRYVVFTTSERSPGSYYFGDRNKKTLEPIYTIYKDVPGELLTNSQTVMYTARDGVEIEAILNLPTTFSDKPVPTIVYPHGGPMARSTAGFDPWVAYFNSRGIAVLQPNFRGSLGYGDEFTLEAVQNYGLSMQDDLTDAANWLVKEGIAEKGNMCMVGASYGGYASIMATVKTPDLFACAISFAGMSDLVALRNQYRNFLNYKVAREQFGTDDTQLKQTSPYYHVDKIKTPILLVHGNADRVVKVEQSQKMAKALEKAGKEFKYIELENGSHNLHLQENRTRFFKEMDTFLIKYLKLQ